MKRRTLEDLKPVLTRRQFLQLSGAAAGAATLNLGFVPRVFAGGATQKVLVYVFLRGGIDGLALLPPIDGPDYGHLVDARDRTLVDINDSDQSRRPLTIPNGQNLGMHPYLGSGGLRSIYFNGGSPDGGMAIVQAVGHPAGAYTRSHFDAQEQIEFGQPLKTDGTGPGLPSMGWLSRYLATSPGIPAPGAIFTAMVSGNNPPTSLAGWSDVATLDTPDNFSPNTGTFGSTHLATLSSLYGGAGALDVAAGAALDAIELINGMEFDNYTPGSPTEYPDNSEGRDFKLIAQLIRQNIGIACATVDIGGWDTHNDQNVFGGGFGSNLEDLNDALTAFYRDLEGAGYIDDVAIVVQSEFGRQVKENASFGTDHGLGNPMFILGGGVKGRRVYGPTLGIAPADRIGDSLVPQTDFRNVLAEVAAGLLGHPDVEALFPDLDYDPVGFSTA
ncbi:MAG: DUF1501 domain-containing protein [Wenzhouxiangella sp.]|jgi:uncharacterized protein (DUF1501 family)|nr:DUF1501 domain-containing protein [Wenzhouxiangella sp.]